VAKEVDSVYPLPVTAPILERQSLDDLAEAERGVVFVGAPQPPRVGIRIQVDVAFDNQPHTRVPALVVWSRPPRAGITAGFRAQLLNAPESVLERIRTLAGAARRTLLARAQDAQRSVIDGPIQERVRLREATSPLRMTPGGATLPPPMRPAPSPPPESERAPAVTAPPPSLVPPPAKSLVPSLAIEPPARQRVSPLEPMKRVRVSFSSTRNYLLHYERFLEHGEVYVSDTATPAVGATVQITLDVPDGDQPLVTSATVSRWVKPPEVPQPGWVARIVDQDGAVAERLATASFTVSAPTLPPPSRHGGG
jgi:Tfp pilus assembly protein PilZ